ncbi:MAG: hypothetical protein COB37_02510, partial [Kordiimonadales bacterium]
MKYFLVCLCLLLAFSSAEAAPKYSDADIAELARLEREMHKGNAEHDKILSDRNANERRILDSNLSPDAKKKAIDRINNNYGTKSRNIVAKRREPYVNQMKKMVVGSKGGTGLTESAGSKFRLPDGTINPDHRGWTGDFDFSGSTLDVYRKHDAIKAAKDHNIELIKQNNESDKPNETADEKAARKKKTAMDVEAYKRRTEITGIGANDPAKITSDVSFGAAETTANFDSTNKTFEDKIEKANALLSKEIDQGFFIDRNGNKVEFGENSKQAKTLKRNLKDGERRLKDVQNNPDKYDSFDKAGDSSHQVSENLRNKSPETSAEFGMKNGQSGLSDVKARSLYQKAEAGLTMSGAQLTHRSNSGAMQGMIKGTIKTIGADNPVLSDQRIEELAVKNGLISDGPDRKQQLDALKTDLEKKKTNPHFENMSTAEAERLKAFTKDVMFETLDKSRADFEVDQKKALVRAEDAALDVEAKRKAMDTLQNKHLIDGQLPVDADGKEYLPDDVKKGMEDLSNAKQKLKSVQNEIVDSRVRVSAAEGATKASLEKIGYVKSATSLTPPVVGPDTPGGAKQTLKKAAEAGKKVKEVYNKKMAKGARKGFVRGGGVASLFGIYQTVNEKGQEVFDRNPDASNTELIAETMWETGKELSNYNKLKGVYGEAADAAYENYKNAGDGSFNKATGGLASFYGNLAWGLGALVLDEIQGMTVDVAYSIGEAAYEGVLLTSSLLNEAQATFESSAVLKRSVDAQLAQLAAEDSGVVPEGGQEPQTINGSWSGNDKAAPAPQLSPPADKAETSPDDVWGETSDREEQLAEVTEADAVQDAVQEADDLWAGDDNGEQAYQDENRYRLEQQIAQDKARSAANNDQQNRRQVARANVRREEKARKAAESRRKWAEVANAVTGALTQVAGEIQRSKNESASSQQSVQVGDYSAVNAYDRQVKDCISNSGRAGFASNDYHAARIGCSQKLGPRPKPTFKTQPGSGATNSGRSSSSGWGNSTSSYSNNTPNYDGLNTDSGQGSASDYGSTSDDWGNSPSSTSLPPQPAATAK